MKYRSLVNETEKAIERALDPRNGRRQVFCVDRVGPSSWQHNGNVFNESTVKQALNEIPSNATVLMTDFGGEWSESSLFNGKGDLCESEIPEMEPAAPMEPAEITAPSEAEPVEGTFDPDWMNKP